MEDLFKPTQPSTPDESQITPDSLDSGESTSLANIFDGLDTDSLLFQAGYYLLVFLLVALLGFLCFRSGLTRSMARGLHSTSTGL